MPYLRNMQTRRMRLLITNHNRSIPHDKPNESHQHHQVSAQMADQQFDLLRNQIESLAIEHNHDANVLERIHQIGSTVALVALDEWKRLQDDLIDDRRAQSHGHPDDIGLAHEHTEAAAERRQLMLISHVEQHQAQNGGQRNDVRVVEMGKKVERRKERQGQCIEFWRRVGFGGKSLCKQFIIIDEGLNIVNLHIPY